MLSRRARSAVAAVLDIARHARGKPLAAKALAARHDLPPRQFESVLQDLVRAGILKGLRGPRGGYELARERRRITVGEVVRAVEAREGPRPGLHAAIDAVLDPLVADATAAFLGRLDGVSVEALCTALERQAETEVAPTIGDYAI